MAFSGVFASTPDGRPAPDQAQNWKAVAIQLGVPTTAVKDTRLSSPVGNKLHEDSRKRQESYKSAEEKQTSINESNSTPKFPPATTDLNAFQKAFENTKAKKLILNNIIYNLDVDSADPTVRELLLSFYQGLNNGNDESFYLLMKVLSDIPNKNAKTIRSFLNPFLLDKARDFIADYMNRNPS